MCEMVTFSASLPGLNAAVFIILGSERSPHVTEAKYHTGLTASMCYAIADRMPCPGGAGFPEAYPSFQY